jgi:hypothetical protein
MSTSEPMNPYDSPQTPQPGMSSGAKVLLGLGIGCGVLVLLCCGGGIIAAVFFGRSMQQAMSEDPETVRIVTESIVEIDVPTSLPPQMSLDWTIPILNRKMMTMAVYADEGDKSALVLFQMDEDFGNPAVMRTQFEESMKESGGQEWDEVELEESEKFTTEINGAEAEFTVGRGKRKEDDREVWQAIGSFDGKGGPAMLFMQLDAENFSKDDAMGVLQSMK